MNALSQQLELCGWGGCSPCDSPRTLLFCLVGVTEQWESFTALGTAVWDVGMSWVCFSVSLAVLVNAGLNLRALAEPKLHWTWQESLCFVPRVQSRLKSCVWWHECHSARWWHLTGQLQALLEQPLTALTPLCSNAKTPWHTFLRDHFSSNEIYFPQNKAGYFSLLENDCYVQDGSSWLLSDRCQSFICPCSHEVEREPRQWFVSFRRGNICLNLISFRHRGCWCWSSQWGWGIIWVPPPQTCAHRAIFIPHLFYSILRVQTSAHGAEGRKGRLQVWQSCWDSEWSERCIRIWGFSLIYHSPPHYVCSG